MKEQPSPAIVAYHEVRPQSNYSYCVTTAAFKDHLRLLRDLKETSTASALVTFDDGEQSQYAIAFPLLEEHGLNATFFVSPELIGSESKFLDWPQLRELKEAGHSIQSHGWSHKFLNLCSDSELAYELQASKKSLEDRLGSAVRSIAVPGGRWDHRVLEACARAGYRRVFVSEPWISMEAFGVRVRGRFMVRRSTGVKQLQKVLLGDKRMLWALRSKSELKRRVSAVIGDGLYHRLWCRLTGYNDFEAARQKAG